VLWVNIKILLFDATFLDNLFSCPGIENADLLAINFSKEKKKEHASWQQVFGFFFFMFSAI
jgi:hypothetical protein